MAEGMFGGLWPVPRHSPDRAACALRRATRVRRFPRISAMTLSQSRCRLCGFDRHHRVTVLRKSGGRERACVGQRGLGAAG